MPQQLSRDFSVTEPCFFYKNEMSQQLSRDFISINNSFTFFPFSIPEIFCGSENPSSIFSNDTKRYSHQYPFIIQVEIVTLTNISGIT